LFTHEHFDHIGGLPQLEFYVRLKSKTPVPVYGGAQTITAIKQQYAFMLETPDIHTTEPFKTLALDGVRYTASPAAHNEGCFGYLIEKRQRDGMRQGDGSLVSSDRETSPVFSPVSTRMAYFPDTGPLPPQTLECLYDLDTLIIDSTFSGANWMPKKHHSIDEAIALAEQLRPKQTYLAHLAMHFDEPITLQELTDRLSVNNRVISVAYDGLRISF
jgi:phosphoribosyl 1,2-cyclic phosphate phosphodiesterase